MAPKSDHLDRTVVPNQFRRGGNRFSAPRLPEGPSDLGIGKASQPEADRVALVKLIPAFIRSPLRRGRVPRSMREYADEKSAQLIEIARTVTCQ